MKTSNRALRCLLLAALVAVPQVVVADEDAPRKPGIELPFNLRLNGRFDLAYERIGFTDKLSEGKHAVRNYHHFLFLSHRPEEKPYFFTAELIDLTFYEAGAKWQAEDIPLRWQVKGGKIFVPFGADPLFHQSYGGLAGFDQAILPAVFTRHGVVGQVQYTAPGGVRLSNQVYGVHGFALPASDAILNLQTDFSGIEKATFGVGNRLGIAWGPAAAWYSVLFNRIDFDARLIMQAFDVAIWSVWDLPVLRDISLMAGVMRADVLTSDAFLVLALEDYYHFGDYVELRYAPLEWLSLRARTGFRSYDNRGAPYYDRNRMDTNDGQSTTAGAYLRFGNWLFDFSHTWRVEAVDEIDNDFSRARVTYEF